jgi:hypothetical protein
MIWVTVEQVFQALIDICHCSHYDRRSIIRPQNLVINKIDERNKQCQSVTN